MNFIFWKNRTQYDVEAMQDDSMNLNPFRVKSKTNHLVNETHPYIVERGLTSLVYDPKFDNNTRGKYIIMVDVWNFDYFW